MELTDILLIVILAFLCIMFAIFIKIIRETFIEIANKIKSIEDKIDCIDYHSNLILNDTTTCINKMQELNKTIYEIYDSHIKIIENYTKYCATSIARKHKSNKNKTNTKQQ